MTKYATHGYDFYFGQYRLPVTPASLSIKTPSLNETVTLINQGQINILKPQGLREISFSFMLPHQKYPFVKTSSDKNTLSSLTDMAIDSSTDTSAILDNLGGMFLAGKADFSPAYFMPLLESLKLYKKVFRFKVYRSDVSDLMNTAKKATNYASGAIGGTLTSRGGLDGEFGASAVIMGSTLANQLMNGNKAKLPNTSIPVCIEELEFEEDAESSGRDIVCNITLKEWKPYSTKRHKISEQTDGKKTVTTETNRQSSKITPNSVVVKSGDTLFNLCKKHLGDGNKYKEIAKLNNISNPNLIYPNQVIRFK